MQSKTRNALAAHIRKEGIPVASSHGQLSFGSYTVIFNDALDYATVYNPYSALASAYIPYASPASMLSKIRTYFSKAPGKSFAVPAHLKINQPSNS